MDFKGHEVFFGNEHLNNNFKPPCIQIAKVDINKFSKSSILSCFIGQFVIIDYGKNEHVLPIYIYSPNIIRTNDHIVILNDIDKYIEYVPSALLERFKVDLNHNNVVITSSNCALSSNWNTYLIQNRPNLDNIPKPNVNGIMTNEQSNMVNNALNNALNHVSDKQQFQ